MKKSMICIECPVGCLLELDVNDGRVECVKGNKCEKGRAYAIKEITSPERFLTSTITAEGLEISMVPVRTDRPIPREKIKDVMDSLKGEKIRDPVKAGDIIVKNILGLEANIIATRNVGKSRHSQLK